MSALTLLSDEERMFQSSVLSFAKDADGNLYPRYRDLFPEKPPEGLVPTCAEAGILGALTGIIGSMQALEVIKEITGTGTSLAGRLLMYDSLASRFEEVRYGRTG